MQLNNWNQTNHSSIHKQKFHTSKYFHLCVSVRMLFKGECLEGLRHQDIHTTPDGIDRQSGGLTLPSHTHSSVTRHSPHTGTYVCTYVRTYIHWYDTKPFALTEQCSVYVHHHHSSQLWQHHWHGLTFSCALLLILSHSSF